VRVNLKKCVFRSSETLYLGFRLSKEGIFRGSDKLKAVKEALPPENIKQICQFLGLCNFFRGHIQNFAQITSPLTQLTKKDSSWKRGPPPENALCAFAISSCCYARNPCWPIQGRIESMRSLLMPPSATRTRRVAWGPSWLRSMKLANSMS
jgi:hypothetical protein